MESASFLICMSFFLVVLCPSPVFTIPQERFYSFGSTAGDVSLPRVLDVSSPVIPLTISPFPYFGQYHNQLFVNSNGHITFFAPDGTFVPQQFPIANDRQVIAPFWADSDTSNAESGLVWYRITSSPAVLDRADRDIQNAFVNQRAFKPAWLLIATWDHVGVFPRLADRRNTFQCVLATDGDRSYVIFLYADNGIEWLWSEDHFGLPAQVGFNAGDGLRYFSHPDSFTTRLIDIPTTTNTGEPGVWVFKVDGEDVIPAGCSTQENIPITLTPRYGHMLGGTAVVVTGPCFSPTDEVICQYSDAEGVTGMYINEEQFMCVSPSLNKIGEVPFRLNILSLVNQRITFFETSFLTVSPERGHVVDIVSPSLMLHSNEVMIVKWTPEDIVPSFLSQNVSSLHVDITLYRQQYIQEGTNWTVTWKEQSTLTSNIVGANGEARVLIPPRNITCRLPLHSSTRSVNVGLCPVAIKVSVNNSLGRHENFALPNSIGVWSGVAFLESSHPNLNLRQVCDNWAASEKDSGASGEALLQAVISCPPNEFLARLDADYEEELLTSLFRRTNFPAQAMGFLHPGVSTCYRQAIPNSKFAGQQCCYKPNGNLVKGEPAGGSVDIMSPKINYNRHLSDDIVPYIYCCKGQQTNCEQYYRWRPSGDETGYILPRPACIYGDPHIITLDGLKYTFNGKGEFTMIETTDNTFTLQGRMETTLDQDGSPTPGTVFTALVARQHKTNTTVQFELRPGGLRVRLDGKVVNFEDISQVITDNVTVVDKGNESVAALFKIGAKMEIQVENGIISVMLITLPNTLKGKTRGLMGTFNEDTTDDLIPKSELKAISTNSSLEDIHNLFGITWILKSASESYFTYNPGVGFSSFYDVSFTPLFKPTFTNSTLEKEAKEVCGDDEYCLFDIAATKKVEIGMATMKGGENFDMIVEMSVQVIICDPPCANGACVKNDSCSCSDGFEGDKCNKPVVSECEVNMCQNNGTCMKHVLTYTCDCPSGFVGAFCQEKEPPFHIRLLNSSPRVSGGVVMIDFETSMPVLSAKCFLTGQRQRDCDSGHVLYSNLSSGSYVFSVLARTRFGEKAVVRRIVHVGESDDEGHCAVHLINEGMVIDGRSAALFFKGTKAVNSYRCRLRGITTDTTFTFCRSPARYEGLEVGRYRFQVLPVGCDNGKRLSVKFDIF